MTTGHRTSADAGYIKRFDIILLNETAADIKAYTEGQVLHICAKVPKALSA